MGISVTHHTCGNDLEGQAWVAYDRQYRREALPVVGKEGGNSGHTLSGVLARSRCIGKIKMHLECVESALTVTCVVRHYFITKL